MEIKTYKIRVEVFLYAFEMKGEKESKKIDLTPWIKNITTDKNINNPSGSFQISLLPVAKGESRVPLYYRVSPMDYIEIRFTRDSTLTKTPVVMRGFVDSVSRMVSTDQNGSPVREYTVSGRDFGKILEITRIYHIKEFNPDVFLLNLPGSKNLEAKFNCKIQGSPQEIIETLLGVAQNQIELIRKTQQAVPKIKYHGSSTIMGEINEFSLTQEDGSVWNLMRYFDNSPWNELYITDLEDAPALVFRETPWKDFKNSNEPVWKNVDEKVKAATLGESIEIEPGSVMDYSLSRSDAELKNYFFTYPEQNLFQGQTSFKKHILDNVRTENDLNSNPYLIARDDNDAGLNRFGFRRFENTSEYFENEKEYKSTEILSKIFNMALQKAFKFNGHYESGSFTIKGNSEIRPGRYVIFKSNTGVDPEFYVVGVRHTINLQEGSEQFSTSLTVQRGDGFLKTRNQISPEAPV